jgi:hypothetical protein
MGARIAVFENCVSVQYKYGVSKGPPFKNKETKEEGEHSSTDIIQIAMGWQEKQRGDQKEKEKNVHMFVF